VEAFVETDKAYLADEANSKKDDGCTAVAAVLLEDRLIVANVGDSRAVLSRGGKGAQASLAHGHDTFAEHYKLPLDDFPMTNVLGCLLRYGPRTASTPVVLYS
jgi:serine/threonine protein phosphatase PrpC